MKSTRWILLGLSALLVSGSSVSGEAKFRGARVSNFESCPLQLQSAQVGGDESALVLGQVRMRNTGVSAVSLVSVKYVVEFNGAARFTVEAVWPYQAGRLDGEERVIEKVQRIEISNVVPNVTDAVVELQSVRFEDGRECGTETSFVGGIRDTISLLDAEKERLLALYKNGGPEALLDDLREASSGESVINASRRHVLKSLESHGIESALLELKKTGFKGVVVRIRPYKQ